MLDHATAALLGLVQALTEFLPVSSSGHLVLAQAVLGVEAGGGAAFEVAVHFGTLLSVAVVFHRDIARLLAAVGRALAAPTRLGARWRDDPDLRLAAAIVAGSVPAGVVGLLFKDQLEAAFDHPALVCGGLIFTGIVLLSTLRAPEPHGAMSVNRAVAIGVAQAVAILPGVSRSGWRRRWRSYRG